MESNARAGVKLAQPRSDEERFHAAELCSSALEMSIPILVDSVDDRVNRAYSGFPDRLYLINRAGQIVYKGGRGPYGYKPRELEQAIVMMMIEEGASRKTAVAN